MASLLTAVKYGGAVAACSLAGGSELTTTVLPFLLRGVNLLGIDSVMRPKANRVEAWECLAKDLPLEKLDALTSRADLKDLPELADKISARTSGRRRRRFLKPSLHGGMTSRQLHETVVIDDRESVHQRVVGQAAEGEVGAEHVKGTVPSRSFQACGKSTASNAA